MTFLHLDHLDYHHKLCFKLLYFVDSLNKLVRQQYRYHYKYRVIMLYMLAHMLSKDHRYHLVYMQYYVY